MTLCIGYISQKFPCIGIRTYVHIHPIDKGMVIECRSECVRPIISPCGIIVGQHRFHGRYSVARTAKDVLSLFACNKFQEQPGGGFIGRLHIHGISACAAADAINISELRQGGNAQILHTFDLFRRAVNTRHHRTGMKINRRLLHSEINAHVRCCKTAHVIFGTQTPPKFDCLKHFVAVEFCIFIGIHHLSAERTGKRPTPGIPACVYVNQISHRIFIRNPVIVLRVRFIQSRPQIIEHLHKIFAGHLRRRIRYSRSVENILVEKHNHLRKIPRQSIHGSIDRTSL